MVNIREGKKNIVVLGAGFAGLRAVKDLSQQVADPKYQLILVDKNDVHLYTPDLYEIAAAFNSKITQECMMALKETVATPISNLIDAKVNFLRDEVLQINPQTKTIALKNYGELEYAILVVCLGSTANYFNIPGLQEHAHPVKTIQDALSLNCDLDMLFHEMWKEEKHKEINIIVGGGGATGVEVAGQLVSCTKKLCKKYQLSDCKVQISLVEASHILAAMHEQGTKIVQDALEKQGVKVLMGHKITEVQKTVCTLENEEHKKIKLNYDLIIWTGGVTINPLVASALGEDDCRGAIKVNESLQSEKHKNIFAAGDNAFCLEKETGQRMPMLAQIAMQQGKVLAANIVRYLNKQPLKHFSRKSESYLIPIGSKCLLRVGDKVYMGRVFWFLKRLVALRYFLSIMPWWKAMKKAWHGAEIFLKNDN